MAIPEDRLLLYAKIVVAAIGTVLISVMVLASVIALLDREINVGELAPVAAIVFPSLIGLVGFALGLPRIMGSK